MAGPDWLNTAQNAKPSIALYLTLSNKGRAFYSSASNLGEYMLVDYVSNRRKRVA